MVSAEHLSAIVMDYLEGRVRSLAPAGDWSRCQDRFSWCGEVLDFLIAGLEEHVAALGVSFQGTYPGPLRLWDEEQHANGEHVRRYWIRAVDQTSGRVLANVCTLFFHRHDSVALPRPPLVVAFPVSPVPEEESIS